MQYETIILELLSRIKKLEDDVSELKQTLNTRTAIQAPVINNEERVIPTARESTIEYKKTTDEMIEMCYKYGKRLANGENAQELAEQITEATGMNRNSAIMYLYAVQGMLDGVIYKRSINATAMKRYFDWIYSEYGSQGLRKAIHATRLHVEYRRSFGHMVDSIEDICARYEKRL